MDEGAPIHYSTVAPGTPIYGADGVPVGKVIEVLDNYREHILDGITFEDPDGQLRFVDAPEVDRTFERAVTLTIDSDAAARLGPPSYGRHAIGAKARSALGRIFGR